MINSEHSIAHIKKECIRIMLAFPKVFPIVEIILNDNSTKNLEGKEHVINYILDQYIGLNYIITSKTNAMAEIWWTLHHSQFKTIEKAIVESVLLCYAKPYLFSEDKDEWEKILKEIKK